LDFLLVQLELFCLHYQNKSLHLFLFRKYSHSLRIMFILKSQNLTFLFFFKKNLNSKLNKTNIKIIYYNPKINYSTNFVFPFFFKITTTNYIKNEILIKIIDFCCYVI
jgi:hypothetical protein